MNSTKFSAILLLLILTGIPRQILERPSDTHDRALILTRSEVCVRTLHEVAQRPIGSLGFTVVGVHLHDDVEQHLNLFVLLVQLAP